MAKKKEVVDLVNNYYETANQENKDIVEEYLENATHLTEQSLKQYRSAAKVWLAYINRYLNNKHISEIKPLDFQKYQNWLYNQGIYEANIKMKRSLVSNINEYLILYYGDEERYKSFRNFVTKAIKVPVTGKKYKKEPLTDEEYKNLCTYLEEHEEWQKLAYLKFTYISGCRKNESASLLKEVVNYKPIEKMIKVRDEDGKEHVVPMKKYKTNLIKCKGKKSDEPRRLSFDEDTMYYLKKWLEVRGEDDCPYMFITGKGEKAHKPDIKIFNRWCNYFEEFIGRRLHPHLLRSSRASSLALHGKNIEAIQNLLGHKSSETTRIYIVKEDNDEEDELFV